MGFGAEQVTPAENIFLFYLPALWANVLQDRMTCNFSEHWGIHNGIRNIRLQFPKGHRSGTYHGDNLGDRWHHAWLDADGLVIDITGDPFKRHPAPLTFNIPIYIGPIAEFHRLFEARPADCSEHHGLERHRIHYNDLRNWYETILKYLA